MFILLFYYDSFVMLDCHLQRRYLIDPCSTNMNMPTKKTSVKYMQRVV